MNDYLDVVVRQGAAILQLLSSEDQALLIWWNSFLVLDLGLDVVNGVRSLDFQRDGLAGEGLDEDLHASTKTENQVQGRFLLDVVVRQSAAILQLLSSEDQALLIWRDAFLVLDLGLDVVDGVRSLDFQRDGLSSQSLDEDLHDCSTKLRYE